MATDARISTALPAHPKTKKLVRRLGPSGGWSLICLFLWAAANRSDGDLAGLSDEDIELASDWDGKEGDFVRELIATRFLDGETGTHRIHDWAEHNPWAAGSGDRAESSRWAALCKRYGRAGAAERMPDYAARMRPARDAHADPAQPHAPSPIPIPSPIPTPTPKGEVAPAEPDEVAGGGTVHDPEPITSLPTMAGAVCVALKASGIGLVNPSHPDLLALLESGVDIGAFVAAAEKAKKAEKATFAYVLGIVKGQAADSQRLAANARASPQKTSSHSGFESKNYRDGVAEDGSFT